MTSFETALYRSGFRSICGVDEVGRGALAGPVVAAAVILPPDCFIKGLRDSKKLSGRLRQIFFEQITETACAIGIGMMDNVVIDRINILQATRLAMRTGINALAVKPDFLLIDALTLSDSDVPQEGIIHGDDRSISIAAASVIAKVTRDRIMCQHHDVFPEYNFRQHKGYGTQEHLKKIKEFGPCHLHRKTFRGVIC